MRISRRRAGQLTEKRRMAVRLQPHSEKDVRILGKNASVSRLVAHPPLTC